MNNLEKKYFGLPAQGMLDADSSAFAVAPNSWINSENIRSGTTDKGVTETIESIGNTTLISQPQPSINYIDLGAADDVPNSRFAKFKFNTTGRQDKIVCYDENTGIEYDVLLSSQVVGGLNFSKYSPIHSARVINGLLYWVDSTNNQPRKINLDAAILANNPSFVPYQKNVIAYTFPINFSEITLIKPPPVYAPTFLKFVDGSFLANLIAGSSFEFTFQFVWYDNETTVTGLYSFSSGTNVADSFFNAIRVRMPFIQKIPDTVRFVNLIVRVQDGTVTGGNNANIIKTWDKEVTSQSAEIENQNNGITQLTFVFYNDIAGSAIDTQDVLRQFDNVPIYSETLENAESRVFPANNTEGYDTPKTTSLIISTGIGATVPPSQVLMDGAIYKAGIVFYDFAMRRCGVVTTDSAFVSTPLFQYNPAILGTIPNSIVWSVNNSNAVNEIPKEAVYYAPVRTQNLKTRFFIEALSVNTTYATKDVNGNYVYTNTTFPAACAGIALNTAALIQAGLGYVFNQGDLSVLKIYSHLFVPMGFEELTVIAQDGNYIIVSPKDIGNLSTIYVEYQIYTPYKTSDNEPFFEVGYIYPVNNPGQDTRSYSTLIGVMGGDVWFLLRQANQIPSSYIALAMSNNDAFYKNWNTDIGKPNFITKLGQVKKTQYFSWSDTFIPNTAINGLSTFRVGNEASVQENCGVIQKLQLTSKVPTVGEGQVMLSICSNETNSMYLSETQITDATGATQFLGTSVKTIGTINTLKGSSGTTNPESVCEYRGRVYWFDAINGRYTQYAENGLFFISSYKMTRFWKNWALEYNSMTKQEIEVFGSRPYVFSVVDGAHDELLISIPKLSNTPPKGYLPDYPETIYPFDILDFTAKTIVFKLEQAGMPPHWQGSYSMTPEMFITLNNQLYSGKNGLTYLHNQTNGVPNTFFGITYLSKIMCVSNMNGIVPKVYNTLFVHANMKPVFVYLYNDYPYQQSSDLVDYDFRDYEGIKKAPIYRNKLKPTATGFTSDNLLTGEKMRNVAMFIMLQFNPTSTPLELKFLEIGFQNSVGQNV